jgi:hypothetical protein
MKRWLRGSVVLATAIGMWSCSGDPTDSFRGGPSRIVATPASLFITQGRTEGVVVQAQDDQGDPQAVTFDTASGPGITVTQDVTFLPTNGAPIQGQSRYLITANEFLGTSFTVSVGEQSLEIPVRVLPASFIGGFSNEAPPLADTVTLTAPTGIRFGANTGITFPGAQGEPFITGISADSTVLSFLPPPGADTLASVTGLELTYALGAFTADTIETTTKVTTPSVTLTTNFSTGTPAVNEVVTVTTTPEFFFAPSTVIFQGGDTATVLAVAADGSSMSFVPVPGADTVPTISGVALNILPEVPLSLPASGTLTVDSVIPTTGSLDPATGPTIPVPADSGFTSIFRAIPGYPGGVIEDRWYKFVVPTDGDYTITVDWTVGSDIDVGVCTEAGAPTFDCDFAAATGNHPETDDFTLTAGNYALLVEDFAKNAAGTEITITMTRITP